ncbi:hypothetical protein CFR78_14565 [Komagataeibacter rhaeticus]|nr:hypothetical protein CT154_15920 [Komagataeibacter xylinus]EGG77969.1 hypothetical protein SXCC_01361 [Gluconacetobacter sp. SXCC-1]PYD52484.1 hypothetical protein CFR78_14565 [Komagataeibacter rhaeticus]
MNNRPVSFPFWQAGAPVTGCQHFAGTGVASLQFGSFAGFFMAHGPLQIAPDRCGARTGLPAPASPSTGPFGMRTA